jgi:ribosomal protein L44E
MPQRRRWPISTLPLRRESSAASETDHILALHETGNYTYAEIAEKVRTTPHTVANVISRWRREHNVTIHARRRTSRTDQPERKVATVECHECGRSVEKTEASWLKPNFGAPRPAGDGAFDIPLIESPWPDPDNGFVPYCPSCRSQIAPSIEPLDNGIR